MFAKRQKTFSHRPVTITATTTIAPKQAPSTAFDSSDECIRACRDIIKRHVTTEPGVSAIASKWVVLPKVSDTATTTLIRGIANICDTVFQALFTYWDLALTTGYANLCFDATATQLRDGYPVLSLSGFSPAERAALAQMRTWPGPDIWIHSSTNGAIFQGGLQPVTRSAFMSSIDRGALLLAFIRCLLRQVTPLQEDAFFDVLGTVTTSLNTHITTSWGRLSHGTPPPCIRVLEDATRVCTTLEGWRVWLDRCVGPPELSSPTARRRTLNIFTEWRNLDAHAATQYVWAVACTPITVRTPRGEHDPSHKRQRVTDASHEDAHIVPMFTISAYVNRLEEQHLLSMVHRLRSTPLLGTVLNLVRAASPYPDAEYDDALSTLAHANAEPWNSFNSDEVPEVSTPTTSPLPDIHDVVQIMAKQLAAPPHASSACTFAPMCTVSQNGRVKLYTAQVAARVLLTTLDIASRIRAGGTDGTDSGPVITEPDIAMLRPLQVAAAYVLTSCRQTSVFAAMAFPYLNPGLFTAISTRVSTCMHALEHATPAITPSTRVLEFNHATRLLCTTYIASVAAVIDRVPLVGSMLRPQHCVRCVAHLLTTWKDGTPSTLPASQATAIAAYVSAVTGYRATHAGVEAVVDAISTLAKAMYTLNLEGATKPGVALQSGTPTVPPLVQELWHTFRVAGVTLLAYQLRDSVLAPFRHLARGTADTASRVSGAYLLCDTLKHHAIHYINAGTALITRQHMDTGACASYGIDGTLAQNVGRAFSGYPNKHCARVAMASSSTATITWASTWICHHAISVLALAELSPRIIGGHLAPLFPVAAHQLAVGMGWVSHPGTAVDADHSLLTAVAWLRMALGDHSTPPLAQSPTKIRAGVKALISACRHAGGWQALWRFGIRGCVTPTGTAVESLYAPGGFLATVLSLLTGADTPIIATKPRPDSLVPKWDWWAMLVAAVADISNPPRAAWQRRRRRSNAHPVAMDASEWAGTVLQLEATSDADIALDVVRTAALFIETPFRAPSETEIAGLGHEDAPTTRWNPGLPAFAAQMWPVDKEAVWAGGYAIAPMQACAQLGVPMGEWVPVGVSPMLEPENTSKLKDSVLYAPFTSCSPDMLNTIATCLPMFVETRARACE